MTKYSYILAVAALMTLGACAQKEKTVQLSDQDRALIMETRNISEEARQQAAQALGEARRALDAAEAANQKAERMFLESQAK